MRRTLAAALILTAPALADDLPAIQDAHVHSATPTQNFGSDPNLFLSATCCPRTFYRAYLQFDVTAYPVGFQAARAEVHWYQHAGGGAGCLPATLHRVTGAWSEGTLDWNNKPTHDANVESTVCVGDNFSLGWKRWDATAVVNGWLSGASANQGVVIRDQSEIPAGAGRLGQGYSSEHTDPSRRPFLRLTFATLTATGSPQVGTTVSLALFAPNDPGLVYVCGSSLGSVPGIPVDTRVIPLNPDGLLLLSLTTPAIFANYQGVLDNSGRAGAMIHIPLIPPLAGVSFHTAFVTVRPGAPSGIGSISDAVPLTIVP